MGHLRAAPCLAVSIPRGWWLAIFVCGGPGGTPQGGLAWCLAWWPHSTSLGKCTGPCARHAVGTSWRAAVALVHGTGSGLGTAWPSLPVAGDSF